MAKDTRKKFKVTLVYTEVVYAENEEEAMCNVEVSFSDSYGSNIPLDKMCKATIKEVKRAEVTY